MDSLFGWKIERNIIFGGESRRWKCKFNVGKLGVSKSNGERLLILVFECERVYVNS